MGALGQDGLRSPFHGDEDPAAGAGVAGGHALADGIEGRFPPAGEILVQAGFGKALAGGPEGNGRLRGVSGEIGAVGGGLGVAAQGPQGEGQGALAGGGGPDV